jgi:hypothetical protein
MSQELKDFESRLIVLINQKDDQEINVMKIKCEIREVKKKISVLKKEAIEQYARNNVPVIDDEKIEMASVSEKQNLDDNVDLLGLLVEKKKPVQKKKVNKKN